MAHARQLAAGQLEIFGGRRGQLAGLAAKLEAAFQEEIARVLKDGFEAQEIEEAKSGWLQGRQVTRAQDSQLVRTLSSYLFLQRTLAFDTDVEKKVQALTAGEIVAALRRHVDPRKISIFKAGDFAKVAAAPLKDGQRDP